MKVLFALAVWINLTTCLLANSIQPQVKVEGKFITLGDLFVGIPQKIADTELLIAPQPGKSIVLNHNWLTSIARKHNINYTPRSRHEHIKVVGASDRIGLDEIEPALKQSLNELLKTESFTLSLDHPDTTLHIPVGAFANVEVSRVSVNSNHTRFQALIKAKMEEHESTTLKISGKIQHMTMVPVLTRVIHKGEIIKENDIKWVNTPTQSINSYTVMDEDVLIGAAPKRNQLKAYQPLRKQEVAIPNMVHKNQAVIIMASTPSIKLSAKGKALENGAKDAYIKIMNVASKRVIHATVVGPKKVRVDISSLNTLSNSEKF